MTHSLRRRNLSDHISKRYHLIFKTTLENIYYANIFLECDLNMNVG